jgi:hypothetical protein
MNKLACCLVVIALTVGCAHQAQAPSMSTAPAPLLQPGTGTAMVVFVRPANWPAYAPTVIDDSGRVLGDLRGGSYFAIEVAPGRHDFVVFLDSAQMVRAECAPGKVYVVQIFGTPGVMHAIFDVAGWSNDDRVALHRELSQLIPMSDWPAPPEQIIAPGDWLQKAHEAFAELRDEQLRAHTLLPEDGYDAI